MNEAGGEKKLLFCRVVYKHVVFLSVVGNGLLNLVRSLDEL